MVPCLQIECAKVRGVLTGFLLLLGLVCASGANTPARADDSCAFLSPEFWPTATVDQVEACIRAGVDIDARGEAGDTPLHQAAAFGTAETVAALITAGAEIEARMEGGLTPLHAAAAEGTAETVATLIRAGANVKARARSVIFPVDILPADLAEDNPKVRDAPVFWDLNDGRY